MVRQILAKTTAPTPFPIAGVEMVETAEDVVNNSRFLYTGKEILLIHNSHASTTYTYTITSVPDAQGRTKDITAQNILATKIHVVGPFSGLPGWVQTDGYVYLSANNAAVLFSLIHLP